MDARDVAVEGLRDDAVRGLFSEGEPALDATFGEVHRTELDATSWVEYVPGWLTGHERLLSSLLATSAWEQRDRWIVDHMVAEPRLTAVYDDLSSTPDPLLPAAAAALSVHYQVPYDALWLNLYRDHRDSTSWHGDFASCKREKAIVPVLSLGAPRRFLLKPRAGGRSIVMTPSGGDLVVMGGRCQRDWRHSVPKQTAAAGVRISVNFSSRWQAGKEPQK